MNKSPINLLQELLIKEGYTPKYSLSIDGTDFKYEVTCKNLSTIGIGVNKKEAKHNAALNMLSLLNITVLPKIQKTNNNLQDVRFSNTAYNNSQSNSINISSSLNTQIYPENNFVGLLQELCVQYRIDLPLYDLADENGPGHMKTFKIRCCVGSQEATGVAHCKKSAKQEAAKNMLQLLIASNILPIETYRKIENLFCKLQDITIDKSAIKITKPVLHVEVSEVAEASAGKALMPYIKPNIAMQNIAVDNDSAMFHNNNNTIKYPDTSMYQRKSIEKVIKYGQTLEDGESTITKSLESAQSSHVKSNFNSTKEQNRVIANDHANQPSVLNINNKGNQRTIEDELRDFNIEIHDHVESDKSTLTLTELSKKAISAYIASGEMRDTEQFTPTNECITDSHNFFKKLYFDKISDDLRKKMDVVSKLENYKTWIVQETFQEIQKELGVKLKHFNCSNSSSDKIICLSMLSTPSITQIGIGATEYDAKAQAMLEIIKTVMEYLK